MTWDSRVEAGENAVGQVGAIEITHDAHRDQRALARDTMSSRTRGVAVAVSADDRHVGAPRAEQHRAA